MNKNFVHSYFKNRSVWYFLLILLCFLFTHVKAKAQTPSLISSKLEPQNYISNSNLSIKTPQNNFYSYTKLGMGISRNSSTNNLTSIMLDSFIPLFGVNTELLFSNIKINYHQHGNFTGGLYLGFRQLFLEKQILYGIYASFDFDKTGNDKTYFKQVTIGFEQWIQQWFFGLRIHEPVGKNENLFERAITNTGIEIGYEFSSKTSIFLEGYYPKTKEIRATPGIKIKLKQNLFTKKSSSGILGKINLDQIDLETSLQKDKLRGTALLIEINFKIGTPTNNYTLDGVAAHMTDTLSKNEIIREDPPNEPTSNTVPANDPPANPPTNNSSSTNSATGQFDNTANAATLTTCFYDADYNVIDAISCNRCPDKYDKNDERLYVKRGINAAGVFEAFYFL